MPTVAECLIQTREAAGGKLSNAELDLLIKKYKIGYTCRASAILGDD